MGGKKGGLPGVKDFFVQTMHDNPGIGEQASMKILKGTPGASRMAKKGGVLENPKVREERQATEDAAAAKIAARQAIKPLPDVEAGKTEARKQAGRRRIQRKGRAATVLSGASETLG